MISRRRALLAAATAAFGAFRLAQGQSRTRVYRVALLGTAVARSPQYDAIERRFRELGYVSGQNFVLDSYTVAGEYGRLPAAAAEIARTRPDVAIATGSDSALKALRQALGNTPIVMVAVDFDPVERNYIASFARPGGNITGVYLRQVESAAKRLELLRTTLPNVRHVVVLFDSATRDQLQAAQQVAPKLGIALLPREFRGKPYDFELALKDAIAAKAEAVLLLSSGLFFPLRDKLLAAANALRLPVIANPNYAEAGALVAFGANFPQMYARAADYVDRILKGAKPAEMPVEQPTQYDLIVNLKTAKALGIDIPQAVLVRATRVIE